MITPLTKKWNNFASSCPFLMFLDVFESRGVGATFAFGFMKKYLFSKKLEHKTFCVSFFINRFWGNIFLIQNFRVSKSRKFQQKISKVEKSTSKNIFPKKNHQNFQIFFQNIFSTTKKYKKSMGFFLKVQLLC